MKSQITTQIKRHLTRGLTPMLLATAILSFGAASSAWAGGGNEGNPGVLPPQSQPHGKSYGQWAVAWWQWALSIPADRNPLTDPTGTFAGEDQSGPVWFVAGTFGDSAERSYQVPAGKALFVPVFNWIFGAGAFDCDPSNPGVPCVVCDLEQLAVANTEAADVLEVFIDGVAVQNVRRYEASSPGPFAVRYPENSVVGLPAGRYFPMVTDGYWLMLKPLAKGTHEIRIHAHYPGLTYAPYEFTVIHHITVTPPAHDRD
ncbi:MAG: hypothetical protein NT154_28380 [Verrucomicrobia bacterium]|nr:hypothetical protein [Verrucomicrobiota bacterium]